MNGHQLNKVNDWVRDKPPSRVQETSVTCNLIFHNNLISLTVNLFNHGFQINSSESNVCSYDLNNHTSVLNMTNRA